MSSSLARFDALIPAGQAPEARSWRLRALLGMMLAAVLLLGGPTAALAAPVVAPESRANVDYVFTIGILERVDARSMVVRFEDGTTETYTLDASTTIRTQNGDDLDRASLKPGDVVMVIAEENSPLAISVVNGGATGFHPAGPADIRGHERECAGCGG
jgi:hypothetical protein